VSGDGLPPVMVTLHPVISDEANVPVVPSVVMVPPVKDREPMVRGVRSYVMELADALSALRRTTPALRAMVRTDFICIPRPPEGAAIVAGSEGHITVELATSIIARTEHPF
jgi:hypothetical protein